MDFFIPLESYLGGKSAVSSVTISARLRAPNQAGCGGHTQDALLSLVQTRSATVNSIWQRGRVKASAQAQFYSPRRRLFCSAFATTGVGDGLAIADVVVLVPRARRVSGCLKPNELLDMLAVASLS